MSATTRRTSAHTSSDEAQSADLPEVELHSAQVNERLVLWAGPSDHPFVKELERTCRSLYYQLVCVNGAQQALRETRRLRFEVGFIYATLTDMAGLSLVRSLRREVGDSLPLAYVTPRQPASDRLEGVHAGVSLYVNDNAGVDAVTQAVRQLQTLGSNRLARVLVIDDEDAFAEDVITAELKGGNFEVSCLTSPMRALEVLAEIDTDLVVIHADMVGLGGFELCRTLRALPEWQALPIMIAGDRPGDEFKIAAYRSGADDYIDLSQRTGVIRASVEGRLERSRIVQDHADRDGLTGLLIRRAFNDALQAQMAAARRRESRVAVCLIDLDHFKSINDTYGHLAGDRVLSALGRLLSSSFRVEDLRGRWGGEEFVVAFSGEDAESGKFILERARREFVEFYFDGEHGERFQATFSAGVSCYPTDGETVEELFKVADRRLYAVKEAGRNDIFAEDPVDHIPEDELAVFAPQEEPITSVIRAPTAEELALLISGSPRAKDKTTVSHSEREELKRGEPKRDEPKSSESLNDEETDEAEILPFFTKD